MTVDFDQRMLEEACVHGLIDHECPEFETPGQLCEYLIELFDGVGMEDVASYWRGNCASVGLI